jgi:Tol biopolymer transport system component/DNA-binding winged helix-turn-helix (wHTH) protein
MALISGDVYEFGRCRLDLTQRLFTREGTVIPLAPKTFELLLFLMKAPGRAFSKQELMAALWPETFVEEANLSYQTSVLRKALGDDGAHWLETIPKHGYRFTADVRIVPSADQARVEREGRRGGLRWAGGRTKWLVAIVATSVLVVVSYLVVSRSRTGTSERRPSVAVRLTGYNGFAMAPAISPDGSRVAFSWYLGGRGSNRDIYVKRVASAEPDRLTTSPDQDDRPAWSPDGHLLAFVRSTSATAPTEDLLVIPATGGDERRLATLGIPDPRRRPTPGLAWTPDGRWIAIGGRLAQDEPEGIWLIAVDRDERRRLTESPAGYVDEKPAFSSDGNRLAFIRREPGKSPLGGATSTVYVIPLSPDLTATGPPSRVTPEGGFVAGHAWIPDGLGLVISLWGSAGLVAGAGQPGTADTHLYRVTLTGRHDERIGQPERLAFGAGAAEVTISRSGRLVYASRFRDSAIWRLPLGGLTDRPVAMPLLSSPFDDHTPDYSRDGKRMAFVSTRSGEEEIWIANSDGSNPVQVTSVGGRATTNPVWSPEGETILFDSYREGSSDLYLIRPDTREFRRLTDEPSDEVGARWSRDGRWIYFGSNKTGQFEVWRMAAAGGTSVRITQHGGRNPIESLDGRFLYYAKDGVPPSIWRMPTTGGEETLVADGLSYTKNFVVADQGVYLVAVGPRPMQDASIDFVEQRTGHRTSLVSLGKPPYSGAALSPDERSMLFATVESMGSNLMLVDPFR